MTTRKRWKIVSGLLAILIVMPIWYYLLYSILKAVNANELMWFLYIVYVPVSIFVGAILKFIDADTKPDDT